MVVSHLPRIGQSDQIEEQLTVQMKHMSSSLVQPREASGLMSGIRSPSADLWSFLNQSTLPGFVVVTSPALPGHAEGAKATFSRSVEMEHAAVSTLTFGRAQHICIAEATHKGHTAEGVQPDGPRAEILHGDIPHLKGQGGEPSEGIQPSLDQVLPLG